MILITRAFSEVTPESAIEGEFSDYGIIAENVKYTFRELVELLGQHGEASSWPPSGNVSESYSTGYYTTDYATATEREESVHYSRENPERNAKYWRKAAIAAGIVKR